MILDATGVGDPIYDDLKGVLPNVVPYVLTMLSKTTLVQRLIMAIAQRQVGWPAGSSRSAGGTVGLSDGENWEILTNELKRYEFEIAPMGEWDDFVAVPVRLP